MHDELEEHVLGSATDHTLPWPTMMSSRMQPILLHLLEVFFYLKSFLKYGFLDSPSSEYLQDALRQLYFIDAIDENGLITRVGKTMTELPLEPSLSRTLMKANEHGCLSQALTVTAMLSAETTLLPGRSKSTDKKRKYDDKDLPNGSVWGDHIQLLQIYECRHQSYYDIGWCKDRGLQVRGCDVCEGCQETARHAIPHSLDWLATSLKHKKLY